jgi:Mg2+/citrate symporter
MGTGLAIAVATTVLGQDPASPDQRSAAVGIVAVMAVGMVVTLFMLRYVGKKERDKARKAAQAAQAAKEE